MYMYTHCVYASLIGYVYFGIQDKTLPCVFSVFVARKLYVFSVKALCITAYGRLSIPSVDGLRRDAAA